MNTQFIALMTVFLSSSGVVWCKNYDQRIDLSKVSHPLLTSFNMTVFNETADDAAIRSILTDIANGKVAKDDSELIELIKKSIAEVSVQNRGNKNDSKISMKAGEIKAQSIVTNVTAAYTRAILRAKSPQEARQLLSRFQTTIQVIVDVTKNGRFAILIDVRRRN